MMQMHTPILIITNVFTDRRDLIINHVESYILNKNIVSNKVSNLKSGKVGKNVKSSRSSAKVSQ